MTGFGISAYGAYIPRLRLQRKSVAEAHSWALPALMAAAKGEKAICNWDEDPITMAVEASRDALKGADRDAIEAITLASTTLPFIDRQNATIIAGALSLDSSISTLDVTGSMRSATSALRRALGEGKPHLVATAEERHAKPGSMQELNYGAAGAAFLLDDRGACARYIDGHSVSVDFVDHYRTPRMDFDYSWEDRWVRDEGLAKIIPPTIKALLDRNAIEPQQVAHVVFGSTLAGAWPMLAKKTGLRAESLVDPLFSRIGDAGAAHPLLLLGSALDKAGPGDLILLIAFGQGCDALLFEASETIAAARSETGVAAALDRGISESSYGRFLSFQGQLRLDTGIRGEFNPRAALTEQYRSADQLAAFTAGQCKACGTVQFPQLAVCVRCSQSAGYDPVPLAEEPAAIATFTLDKLSHYPAPPLKLGLVQFDNGARTMMEFIDADPDDLKVGARVRMMYRIKDLDHERSYRKYFWKAAPVRGE